MCHTKNQNEKAMNEKWLKLIIAVPGAQIDPPQHRSELGSRDDQAIGSVHPGDPLHLY